MSTKASAADPDAPLRGDVDAVIAVDTRAMDWQPSPSRGVLRKRLHRVGPAESGRVTSIVRYEPGASFPAHDHPEGEEILVLQGVFSDEHGDHPEGTYLLNPEGFRHAPFSKDGCTIFVKLRQAPGRGRLHERHELGRAQWSEGPWTGVRSSPLHLPEGEPDETWLIKLEAGPEAREIVHERGAELLVISGTLRDQSDEHRAGSWLRLPVGHRQWISSPDGCTLYAKLGGLGLLG
jgi:anti-sigma factor ChrR (cupin superfamily)